MNKPKQPKTPNAQALTAQQKQMSDATAADNRKFNNIDVRGPTGDVTYEIGPDGRMTQRTTLNANQQGALGAQQSASNKLSQVADQMAGSIDTGAFGIPTGLPSRVTGLDTSGMKHLNSTDYGVDREKFTADAFAAAKRLLDPEWEMQDRRLQQTLSDRGLPMTGEAYDHEMGQFRGARGRAYEDAAFNAMKFGADEQSRLFGLDTQTNEDIIKRQLTDAGLRDSARNSGIEEAWQEYNAPVERIKSLYGASPTTPIVNPQAFQGFASQGGDIAGNTWAAYNADMEKYKAAMEQQNAMMNAIAGVAGTATKAIISDENVKYDIGEASDPMYDAGDTSIIDAMTEMPIKSWRYDPGAVPGDDGSKHVGPMAQDFKGFFGLGNGKEIPIVDGVGINMAATQQLARKVRAIEARL